MRYTLLAVLLVTANATAARLVVLNDGEIIHSIEEVTPPAIEDIMLDPGIGVPPKRDSYGGVDFGSIINLAERIWEVIVDNKATAEVKYEYANALPLGVKGGMELEAFSDLQVHAYRLHGENYFGSTVYDVGYTLVHRYNGSYNGHGRYLDNVTVLPSKVDVSWGYNVNLSVASVTASNVATKLDPVAALVMDLSFRVQSVMKVQEFHANYEFRGDSAKVRAIHR